MSAPRDTSAAVARLRSLGLVVGLVGAAACALGYFVSPTQLYAAYLIAYLFWLGIALGSLAVALLHHLTGGGWGLAIRRHLEAAYGTLPLMAVLFLPLLTGLETLYPWAREDVVAGDRILQAKAKYLNVEFFTGRAIACFAVWILLGFVVNRMTQRTDPAGEPLRRRRLSLLAGPGLILWGLAVTFASIDWAMSLEPHWYSSMYGVLYAAGFVVSAMAIAILVVSKLAEETLLNDSAPGIAPWNQWVTRDRLHDLGNLLMAFMLFWAYVSFMQYLIIWSGNIPEEATWYVNRTAGGWQSIAILLMALHFAVPFLFLLARENKRDPSRIRRVAALLLVMRLVDLYWLIQPAFSPKQISAHWLHLAAIAGIGGLWLALYAVLLPQRAKLPLIEIPEEATANHEHPAHA